MKEDQRNSSTVLFNRIARILAVAFAIFISLFALDVFESGIAFGRILLALLIHLIPTYFILILTWIAWKHPAIGGGLFILAGMAYPLFTGTHELSVILLMTGIPVIIGSLFLAGYFLNKNHLQ